MFRQEHILPDCPPPILPLTRPCQRRMRRWPPPLPARCRSSWSPDPRWVRRRGRVPLARHGTPSPRRWRTQSWGRSSRAGPCTSPGPGEPREAADQPSWWTRSRARGRARWTRSRARRRARWTRSRARWWSTMIRSRTNFNISFKTNRQPIVQQNSQLSVQTEIQTALWKEK